MSKTTGSPCGRSAELRANCTAIDARVDAILDPHPLADVGQDRFVSLTGYNDSLCPEIRQVYEAIAQELPLLAPDLPRAASNIECAVLRVIFLWAALGQLGVYVGGEGTRVFRIRTAAWTTSQKSFLQVETVTNGELVIASTLCRSRADRANEGGPALLLETEVARALAPKDASDGELGRAVDAVIAWGLRLEKPPTRLEQEKEVLRRLMLIRRIAKSKDIIAFLRERSPQEWANPGRRAG